jgi:Lon protease-like protein
VFGVPLRNLSNFNYSVLLLVTGMNTIEPACHSYLGGNLRSAGLRPLVVDPEASSKVLLITLPDVVLFPGETVPLRIQDELLANRVNDIITWNRSLGDAEANVADMQLIGILTVVRTRTGRAALATVGTILDLKSSHFTESSLLGGTHQARELVLTAKGRYRFKVQSVRMESHGVRYATATVLVDSPCVAPWESDKQHTAAALPTWVYAVYSPVTLARRAYRLAESCLFWNVRVRRSTGT